jgi:SAM-dependent methyltransferase
MSDKYFDDIVRHKMLRPYEPEVNTRGREFLNRVFMPRYASFFKDGDKILSVGVHPMWDYSVFFNGPHKQCEFIVSDVQDTNPLPDVKDNMGKSQFPSESFDGIILVGVYDSLHEATANEITSETLRLLKPGGRVLVATTAGDQGSYNPVTAWPDFVVDEVAYVWGDTHMVDLKDEKGYYGRGVCYGIFLIMRKK